MGWIGIEWDGFELGGMDWNWVGGIGIGWDGLELNGMDYN